MRVLVLDVEGTIIDSYSSQQIDLQGFRATHYRGYDTATLTKNEDRFRDTANIDPNLKRVLRTIAEAGVKIVLATGTSGLAAMGYYQSQFEAAGFDQYISFYEPTNHNDTDDKVAKLKKYLDYFTDESPFIIESDFYFFDDGSKNVERAQKSGFVNAYQVTPDNPLTKLLKEKCLPNLPSSSSSSSLSSSIFSPVKKLAKKTRVAINKPFSKRNEQNEQSSDYNEDFVVMGKSDKDANLVDKIDNKSDDNITNNKPVKPSAD